MSTSTTKWFADRLGDLITEKKEHAKVGGEKIYDKDIAAALGISSGAMSNYLNDNAVANINVVAKAADYFGVSTDYLLGCTEVRSPDIEIQAICGKTGLSEKSVKRLIQFQYALQQNIMTTDRYPIENESLVLRAQCTTNLLLEESAPQSEATILELLADLIFDDFHFVDANGQTTQQGYIDIGDGRRLYMTRRALEQDHHDEISARIDKMKKKRGRTTKEKDDEENG